MQLIRSRWPVRIVVTLLFSPLLIIGGILAYNFFFGCHQFFVSDPDGWTIVRTWPAQNCTREFSSAKIISNELLREFPENSKISTLMINGAHLYAGFKTSRMDLKQLASYPPGGVWRMDIHNKHWENFSDGLLPSAPVAVPTPAGSLSTPMWVDINSLYAAGDMIYAGTDVGAYKTERNGPWRQLYLETDWHDVIIRDAREFDGNLLLNLGTVGNDKSLRVFAEGQPESQYYRHIVEAKTGLFASAPDKNEIYQLRHHENKWIRLPVALTAPVKSMAVFEESLYAFTQEDGLVRINLASSDYSAEFFPFPQKNLWLLAATDQKIFASDGDCLYAFDLPQKKWSTFGGCLRCKRGDFSAIAADDFHVYLGTSEGQVYRVEWKE